MINLAYNVFHYQHALRAIAMTGAPSQSLLPITPPPWLQAIAGLPGLRRTPMRRISRRSDGERQGGSLGATEFVAPLLGYTPFGYGDRAESAVLAVQSRRVARRLSGDILLFAEGLGLASMDRSTHNVFINERRNLHEDALIVHRELPSDFPQSVHSRDRVLFRDRLDAETEAADLTVVYSPLAAQSFLERGVPSESLYAVPLFTKETPSAEGGLRPPRDKSVLFIGRCTALKGIDIAVQTVQGLPAGFSLKVAGYASPQMVSWLRQQPRVEYLGLLSRLELRHLVRAHPVVLSPGTESFGLAALDAAVNGAVIVASESLGLVGWLPKQFHLVDQRDTGSAWAAAVLAAFDDASDLTLRHERSVTAADLSLERSAGSIFRLLSSYWPKSEEVTRRAP